ncbi:LysR family transcriptional regulator [Burkholderia gladioli pv. gladioli]|uniref:LysR family transcriptional regulator n=1 Tax=Burkholderia gladioli TaxID=28095 RepID=UPI0024BC5576|nr:LysR family transcriptional regulator [Burkholderia gladioli]MDJ1163940.1 LysR family transcriptional regulator [Burkholderia gladioli pv. gladioli]
MRKDILQTGLFHAIRAFLRVVDSGSFTAAAEQMDLTTAQVSRLVSDLEKRLDVKLLQRSTRHRILTDAGAEYAERCREIVALMDEADAKASGTALSPAGRLRVQCMASFGHHYVAPELADFCATYPELTVNYSTSQYFPDLLARGVDVSFYLAESLTDSGLVARRLGTTFAVVCASPEYLQRFGEPAMPAELNQHACLRLVNPSITPEWRLTDGQTAVQAFTPLGPLVADTPELLLDVAIRGAGITLLPLFSVIDAIRDGRLRRVLPAWRSPDIGIYALLPSRHFMDAKTRAWLEWAERRISPRLQEDAAFFTL